jgi:hypothetical protein
MRQVEDWPILDNIRAGQGDNSIANDAILTLLLVINFMYTKVLYRVNL